MTTSSSLFPEMLEDAANAPKKPPVYVEPPDEMADKLVSLALVPNRFILDLNGSLTARGTADMPYPWHLPSRLLQFPIEVGRLQSDGTRHLSLRHPLLTEHPSVQHVEKTLGLTIDPNAAEPHQYGTWWHAVDLVTAGRWHDLLETSRFTTEHDIAGAVSFGLHYSPHEGPRKRNGYLSTAEAREMMAALDVPEPPDRASTIDQRFMQPSPLRRESGKEDWPINTNPGDASAKAWGMILAIEAGWFAYDRAGFLGWTAAGRDRFPPAARVERLPAPAYTPPAPEPKIADEIAPKLTLKAKQQMDLF